LATELPPGILPFFARLALLGAFACVRLGAFALPIAGLGIREQPVVSHGSDSKVALLADSRYSSTGV
jgi:hypothetical protein